MSARLGIQVEDAARAQLALLDLGERDQVALRRRPRPSPAMIGASRPRSSTAWPRASRAASARLTLSAGRRLQRRPRPAAAERRKRRRRRRRLRARSRLDAHPASRNGPTPVRRSADDMAEAAEHAPHVAGERAHIGALAAFGARARRGRGRESSIRLEAVDLDRARPRARPPRRRGRDHRRARRRS